MEMFQLSKFVQLYLNKMGENKIVFNVFLALGLVALLVWVSVLIFNVILKAYIRKNDADLEVEYKKVKKDRQMETERTKIQKELTKQKKEKFKQEKYESKRIHLELKNEFKNFLVNLLKTYKNKYL